MPPPPFLIAIFLTACSLAYAQGVHEDFAFFNLDESLPMKTDSGWRQELPSDEREDLIGSAVVREGYDFNPYLSLTRRMTFVLYEQPDPLWTHLDGPVNFYLDFRIVGKMPIDITLHNGRTTAGFKVIIRSAEKTIQIAEYAAESKADSQSKVFDLPNLEIGAWYTLEIRDINLSTSEEDRVESRLYLYEQGEPARLLLDGVSIRSGGFRAFDRIGTLQVRRWGSDANRVGMKPSYLDIDNFILEGAEAPSGQ